MKENVGKNFPMYKDIYVKIMKVNDKILKNMLIFVIFFLVHEGTDATVIKSPLDKNNILFSVNNGLDEIFIYNSFKEDNFTFADLIKCVFTTFKNDNEINEIVLRYLERQSLTGDRQFDYAMSLFFEADRVIDRIQNFFMKNFEFDINTISETYNAENFVYPQYNANETENEYGYPLDTYEPYFSSLYYRQDNFPKVADKVEQLTNYFSDIFYNFVQNS